MLKSDIIRRSAARVSYKVYRHSKNIRAIISLVSSFNLEGWDTGQILPHQKIHITVMVSYKLSVHTKCLQLLSINNK